MNDLENLLESRSAAPSPTPKILGIGGSPRKGGNSDVLLDMVIKGARERQTAAHALQLRDYQYQGCIGCEKCRKDTICNGLKDGMSLIYPDIIASGGLVLVCPTHNYNVTAWMKAFIDRLYCFYNFADTLPRQWSSRLADQGRRAALVSVCEQEDRKDMGFALEAMRLPLEALGYDIVGELPVFRVFDRARVKEDADAMARAFTLGSDLAASLEK